jgi:3-oxoacyl-[acyl-carrier protein] reductase
MNRGADLPLQGKVALVTGGSRRIGKAIALKLATAGAALAVNARTSRAEVDATVAEIEAKGGRAVPALADITDAAANSRMIETTVAALGRLDIVVHNAVVREHGLLEELDIERWRIALSVVLDGAFLTAKHAAPHLERVGGTIIMIGGTTAFTGGRGPATPTAKAGLGGLVKSLATALGPKGVTANLVSPGRIEAEDDTSERKAYLSKGRPDNLIPLRRPGVPADVADVVVSLAGPHFRYVTGQTIHVTGGFYMGQ